MEMMVENEMVEENEMIREKRVIIILYRWTGQYFSKD
jgi:hypothetical protein